MKKLKLLAGILIALPLIAFAFSGIPASIFTKVAFSSYGQDKVTICHNGKTMQVAAPAVQAHLNHGDTLGACP